MEILLNRRLLIFYIIAAFILALGLTPWGGIYVFTSFLFLFAVALNIGHNHPEYLFWTGVQSFCFGGIMIGVFIICLHSGYLAIVSIIKSIFNIV